MKRLLSFIVTLLFAQVAYSQITITASDMPVAGDTLRYSIASPLGSTISPGDSGAGVAWNYSLAPTAQAVDSYKTAAQVSLLYAITVGTSAFGYKIADSFPGLGAFLPVSIHGIYTFFEEKTAPSRFEAMAFAANIGGLPAAFRYSKPDIWYYFPLNYHNYDSSDYALTIALDTAAGIKERGYRKTRVDGWGTIVTPYYTTPVNCIRVRSEKHEIDSVSFAGFPFAIPNNTIEYKWLVNGDHFPALWVTSSLFGGVETITSIWYRDSARDTSTVIDNAVPGVSNIKTDIKAYPNPTVSGLLTFDIPTDWKTFVVAIFDMQSREMTSFKDSREISIRSLPKGQYIARITSGNHIAYVPLSW